MRSRRHSLPMWFYSPHLKGKRREGFSLLEILIVFVITAVLIALVVNVASRAMMQAKQTMCLSNMRQVANVLLRYTAENEWDIVPAVILLPPAYTSGETWMVYLDRTGYLPKETYHEKWSAIMTCPARERPGSYIYNQTHYAINRNMGFDNISRSGQAFHKMTRIRNPSQTMLLGESEGDYMIQSHSSVFLEYNNKEKRKIAFPHNETCNLIFMDGHAEVSSGPWKIPNKGDSYPFYGD